MLALDTSSVACSVALQLDDSVTERHEEQPREHTRLLLPMIESLLREAGAELRELDAIVLGNGPGSFIGMRIAASVAQGLAFGAGLGIVPVSSLAAIAAQVFAEHDAAEVVVAQDAHMQEVYLGLYRRGQGNEVANVVAERLQGQSRIAELEAGSPGTRLAAGAGWQRYPELLAVNRALLDRFVAILHPRARYLLPLGARGYGDGMAVMPENVVPAYVRQTVAAKPVERS